MLFKRRQREKVKPINEKEIAKLFEFLINDYGITYIFQEHKNCFNGYWYVRTYSFYNKSGCFTIHELPQRGEWDYFFSEKFSKEHEELTANSLNVFSVEKEMWQNYNDIANDFNSQLAVSLYSNKTWNAHYNVERAEIETLAKVIKTQIVKHSSFFGVKVSKVEEKETYFIPKSLLPGTCYFEFRQGKYKVGGFGKTGKIKLDSSLYLYGDDDNNYNYSAIAPFTCLISGSHPNPKAAKSFDYFGITYIDENDGKVMVENLRKFASLLSNGKTVIESLESMSLFSYDKEEKRVEDTMGKYKILSERICAFDSNRRVSMLSPVIMKNTAEKLADWAEKTLAEFKVISILGI